MIEISGIMSKYPVAVAMDDLLSKIKQLCDDKKLRHLLVVEDDELFGLSSDRDLVRSINPLADSAIATS